MNDKFAHKAAEWDSPQKVKMTEIFVAEMLKHITPQKLWKALEIGAGTGLVGMQILPLVNAIVFEDTSEAMLCVLKQKLQADSQAEILHGEITDYTNQDIDFVFSCMAFHHIPDIVGVLEHLNKITTSNAVVAIGDLVSEDGSFHSFEPIPHKGFDTKTLSEQFRQAGFQVITTHVYHNLQKETSAGNINEFSQFILIAKKL